MHHFAVFIAYVPTPYTCCSHLFVQFFSSLLYFINDMLLELQHDACCSCVLPLPYLFNLFSMLTTPFLLPIFLHSYSTLHFPGLHCFAFVAAIMIISLSAVIHHAIHSSSIYAFLIVHLLIHIHLSFVLAYCVALIAVYACHSISDLHAINTPCSIIDCHIILLIIWFIPVIHSLLVIYTHLLLASCLSFGSCSSCHATWPAPVILLVLFICFMHHLIHADCLVCVCYAIPACQFILACHSLVLVNQFVQSMLVILFGLVILLMFVVWVVLTLFDLCSLCSLCLSCNLLSLLTLFWLSCCLVHLYHSFHAYHLVHAYHSFLAHHSVLAPHCIPAFHLGHAHLFTYASLWIMLVICFMLILQFCLSFPSCLLFLFLLVVCFVLTACSIPIIWF